MVILEGQKNGRLDDWMELKRLTNKNPTMSGGETDKELI